jgi:prefoldin subunit 5
MPTPAQLANLDSALGSLNQAAKIIEDLQAEVQSDLDEASQAEDANQGTIEELQGFIDQLDEAITAIDEANNAVDGCK